MSNKKSPGIAVPEQSANLNAAIAYSQMLGWSIFPIYYKSKKPITQHGFKDASNNVEQIKRWYTEHPSAGIGLPTGKINDVVVLDIDPRNRGDVSLEELQHDYEDLPDTVLSLTGGGGQHFFFQYDERINKSKLESYEGVDVQGDGKYIVLPPSTHPNGNKYEYEYSSKPIVTQIAKAPEWLIQLASKPKEKEYQKKPSSHWIDIFHHTSEGTRNNAAAQLAGHLFRRYVDPSLVVEIMHLWNTKVDPPLEGGELNKIINSIAGKELKRRSLKGG
ncbi:bifunctional DNA primase/polymerase [Gracilibacillus sp. S3-1-1]|uniref:Bifunctional DNA primase/polymerase n=1 Tax=Gracilibacillus pellucidus TaxID=3095368 RepID=A0ACC6M3B8_9BACI|nr:bifunctional DNA primase/polymerase [Gracilibacillus sp. S3-1-1]MDX8045446.1 bifunctional DNA primase/polymerase [Gracilibacillus sp. S3-1-1]